MRILTFILLLCTVIPCTHAADQKVLQVQNLLEEIDRASREVDYSGRYLLLDNGQSTANAIVSLNDGAGLKQKITQLDWQNLEWLRFNNTLIELHPEQKLAIESSQIPPNFPALILRVNDFAKYYQVYRMENTRFLAGRECVNYKVISLTDDRPNWYLCVDKETGLLLDRQIVSIDNKQLAHARFIDLQTGNKVDTNAIKSAYPYKQWLQQKVVPQVLENFHKSGWRIRYPNGFEVISSTELQAGDHPNTVQLLVSDGLSAFSVFIQKLSDQEKQFNVDQQMVMRHTYMYAHRVDDCLVMVVGLMPMSTLKSIATSATYIPPAPAP